MNIFLPILSGILLDIAFPPFNIIFMAWLALIPLLISVHRSKTIYQAFSCGFICGLIFFGGILFWINTLIKWGTLWVVVGYLGLVTIEALFIGMFSACVFVFISKRIRYEIVLIPLLWVVIEWARSLGPLGITAGGLGYSQIDFAILSQIARIFWSYGISFLIVLVNVLIFQLISSKGSLIDKLKQRRTEAALVAGLLLIVLSYGYFRLNEGHDFTKKLKISVIQASIPQDMKLDYNKAYAIFDAHYALSKKAAGEGPQVIIWPETAVTCYINLNSYIQGRIQRLATESRAYYLIGAPYTTGEKNYNAVVAFSPEGKVLDRYDKQKLVTFGEYLPMRPVLKYILRGVDILSQDYHSDSRGNIIDLGIAKAGVVICFESTFPGLVKGKVKKGADFIVVVTNDAWFGRSSALLQHLQSSRMRAIENGEYVVQAANTGISAIIDPYGRVIKRTDIDDEVVLTGYVYY